MTLTTKRWRKMLHGERKGDQVFESTKPSQ